MKRILLIDNSKIEVFFENDMEKIKRNLIQIYDLINEIADSCEECGIDTSNWFYTKEELEKLKKDSKYNFL